MYKKILVPFDGSESARHALESALDLASGVSDAQITVLKVVDWHDYNAETFKIASRMSGIQSASLDAASINEIGIEAEQKEAASVRDEIASLVGQAPIEVIIINGSPHDAIVEYASDLNFDCIVMGHRGMGVIRGMLGSVAFSVLQKANKPILVVK